MEINFERIQELIQNPQESLSVELKAWIDPTQPEGMGKIVKAALAMRNHNGGYIIFGFDNTTKEPILDSAPINVKQLFHIDKIQQIISKYSSELFEVAVEFPQRDGQEFPVIVIPTGIKTPVVAKSELLSSDNRNRKPLINIDTVYVRSLSSNNTASSTQAKWQDWDKLMEVCFDNREADIGRFIRRHLSSINSEQLNTLVTTIQENIKPDMSTNSLLTTYLQECEWRYEQLLKERKVSLPQHGSWEVGLVLVGKVPHHEPNQNFLNLLSSSNPNYSGWSVWLDSRQQGKENAPFLTNSVFDSLLLYHDSIDFMRLDPKGKFFLRRAFTEDMQIKDRSHQPLTELYCDVAIRQVAESIAVGIAFAKAMKCPLEETTLAFSYKWTNLKGRKISSWETNYRLVPYSYVAYTDEVINFVNVPLDTPLSALSHYVHEAVKDLFSAFSSFNLISMNDIEDLIRRLIERK